MDINPINMKRIYQSIIEQFIGLIKDGKVKVGDKLPSERTLAGMFNVSRASIREAFSAMEIIGLVEARPGDGSFITDLNIGPFINAISPLFVNNENLETDLLDFRKLIETEAVKLTAVKPDCGSPALLGQILDSMREAMEEDNVQLGAEADIKFHKTIFSLCGNIVLIKASECIAYFLESSVRFNRAKILQDGDNARVLYNQHKQIYEAIRDGDPEKAAVIMAEHLDFVHKVT